MQVAWNPNWRVYAKCLLVCTANVTAIIVYIYETHQRKGKMKLINWGNKDLCSSSGVMKTNTTLLNGMKLWQLKKNWRSTSSEISSCKRLLLYLGKVKMEYSPKSEAQMIYSQYCFYLQSIVYFLFLYIVVTDICRSLVQAPKEVKPWVITGPRASWGTPQRAVRTHAYVFATPITQLMLK